MFIIFPKPLSFSPFPCFTVVSGNIPKALISSCLESPTHNPPSHLCFGDGVPVIYQKRDLKYTALLSLPDGPVYNNV